MSLATDLVAKALDTISDQDKQKAWIEKGFDVALKEGAKLLPSGDGELKAVRESGEYAIAKLEKHKGALVKLGEDGLASTMQFLSLGDYTGATRHADALISKIKTGGWDDVSSAIVEGSEAGNVAKREHDAAMAEIAAALKDIGVTAAKSILPVLLMLI